MADSEEAILLRRRARRRLVGAIALVVFAVIVLPIVFDKEPRPISQDIVIQIPSQNSGKFNTRLVPSSPEAAKAEPDVPKRADSIPLPPASAVEGPNGVAGKTDKDPGEAKTAAVSKAQEAKGAASDQRQQEAKSAEGKAADKKAAEAKVSTPRTTDTKIVESSTIVSKAAESKPVEAKPAVSRNADTKSTQKAKGESKDGARVAEKPVSDVDSSRAQALLQGDSYVVPLGAFLNQANVKTLQAKVTVAGFKSYSEIQKVAKGEQIRVRAGPFSSREEAERAREQLQAAGMTVGPVTKL